MSDTLKNALIALAVAIIGGLAVWYLTKTDPTPTKQTIISQTGNNNQAAGRDIVNNGVSQTHYDALLKKHTLTEAAVNRIQKLFQKNSAPYSNPVNALDEFAEKYVDLQNRLERIDNKSPLSDEIKQKAKQAFENGDLKKAERLLNEAALTDLKQSDKHWKSAIESYVKAAEMKELEFNYLAAANYYNEAADNTPRKEHDIYIENRIHQANRLNLAGRYYDSLKINEDIVNFLRINKSVDKKLLPQAISNLANSHLLLNKMEEAEKLLKEAFEIGEKILKPDDPIIALLSNNLAEIYRETNKYSDAEPLYIKALKIIQKPNNYEAQHVATLLNNLALLYQETKREDKAENFFKKALVIHESTLGVNHHQTGIDYNNLALLYQDIERYVEAEELFLKAIKITEFSLGPYHPVMVTRLNNLANLYLKIKQYKKAIPIYKRAIKIDQNSNKLSPQGRALLLNELATCYLQTEQLDKVTPLLNKALSTIEKSMGSQHPATQMVALNYALFLGSQGNMVEANMLIKNYNLSQEFLDLSESKR
ncbi:tetratricopeptide repeat protein [Terasakiella sp. A23]|uniref:tetratricopeptide repeat protein n=1 Tax=Terasakiella sp. FCG-A23 TaxID=3080561 RepID=UPI002953F3FE|nr:tetratricopeptide repeat protein [Terasakiella sp. A23]MDV7341137.1 tetratricopeptide repeat protein [Terasakiella sp. A23]